MISLPTNVPDVSRPTQVRWLIFTLACISSGLLYLHRYSWGVIKPQLKKDYPDLTDVQFGWLDSAFNVTYAFGQVPTGVASDLLGPRAILTGSVFLWTLMVVATALVHGFWPLATVRAVFGLSQAGTYPVLGQLTRHWFPRSIRTSVQGIVAAMGRFGGAAAPLIVATLLMGKLGLSWRGAFLFLAFPGLLLTLAVWIVVRLRPRDHPWANTGEQRLVQDPEPPVENTNPGKSEVVAPGPTTFQRTPAALITFAMLLLYSFISTFADALYVFWIPSFLVEVHEMDNTRMGLFAPLPLLGGAAGGIVGGLLNDFVYRLTGNRRWSRSGVAGLGKLLAAALMAGSLLCADGRLAMLVLLACKFFCDWSQPTQWGTITDIGGRASATVFGVVNTVGNVGAIVASPVMGYWKQQHGWQSLFLGVAVIYLVAAVLWLFIDCTRKLVR